MNFDYCFMKWMSGVLIIATLLTTACTSTLKAPAETDLQADTAQAEVVVNQAVEQKLPPTNPDVMYHVFTAEILGGEGDLSGAAAAYLEAALISEDPEIAQRAARVAVSAGEWQMVALASDRWAMLDPSNMDALELAAGSRLREGDYVGAEFQLTRILRMADSDPERGWRVVTALLAPVNDKVRAYKVLDNLVSEFNAEANVESLYARSQLSASYGDLDEANVYIDRAIALEPGRADLLAWSGRLAVNTGDRARALERYRQAWEAGPDDVRNAMSYAELLKRNKQLTAAQAVLSQLPDTPDLRFARMVFAMDADDRGTAENLYTGFPNAGYEDSSEAAFQAAQGAELLDYKREAINWYAQVTGERSLRSSLRQAFLLADLGDLEDARALLAQLRLQADSEIRSQSFQVEARILQEAGHRDEAYVILNDALETLPEDNSLRYSRALLAVVEGDLELAESDFRQIISDQPDNAAAINALGYTLADLTDRFEEAEQLILLAYEIQPDDPSIIDSMGWVSYRLGRLQDAESYLREAWEMMQNAEVAAHLGEVLWVQGKTGEARSIWQMGTQIDDHNEVLIKTLQRFGETP
jgi:Flp pilus assembly protein TadD